jgi:hypothetical protein
MYREINVFQAVTRNKWVTVLWCKDARTGQYGGCYGGVL